MEAAYITKREPSNDDDEVYTVHNKAGDGVAVIKMRRNTANVFRDMSTSDADNDGLARAALDTTCSLYIWQQFPAPQQVRIALSQTALVRLLDSLATSKKAFTTQTKTTYVRTLGHKLTKQIDRRATAAVRFRAILDQDAFQQWLHDDACDEAGIYVDLGLATDFDAKYAELRRNTERGLPQGVQTPHNYIYTLFDDDDGDEAPVGRIWIDVVGSTSYCYKFLIEKPFRGKGRGKLLLAAWEAEAGRLGATTLALHVYERNKPAQALYRSYGFVTEANTYLLAPEADETDPV